MTINILLEIVKELLDRKIIHKHLTSVYGKCLRKAYTESIWDNEYDAIEFVGVCNLSSLPKAVNKFTGIEIGRWIKVGTDYYIIKNKKTNYNNFTDKFSSNSLSIVVNQFLELGDLEEYQKKLIRTIAESKEFPENIDIDILSYFELNIDGQYKNNTNKLFFNKIVYLSSDISFEERSNVKIMCMNHRNFIRVFDKIFDTPILGTAEYNIVYKNMYEVLDIFDKKYLICPIDRVICRMLLYCTIANDNIFGIDSFMEYLKFKKIWKKIFSSYKKILYNFSRDGYSGTSPESQARFLLRKAKECQIEKEDIYDYILPVLNCTYLREDADIEKLKNCLETTVLVEVPITGKDILDRFPDTPKKDIGEMIRYCQFKFDQNINLTKEDLLNLW